MNNIPNDNFEAGFIVGWQTIKGTNAGIPGIPGIPGQPGCPANKTPFLVGVQKGIEAVLGHQLA